MSDNLEIMNRRRCVVADSEYLMATMKDFLNDLKRGRNWLLLNEYMYIIGFPSPQFADMRLVAPIYLATGRPTIVAKKAVVSKGGHKGKEYGSPCREMQGLLALVTQVYGVSKTTDKTRSAVDIWDEQK